jgi:glutamate transport system substrate-binding protein
MRARRLVFPVLLLAVALVAAGCGGKKKQSTSATTASTVAVPSFPPGSRMAEIQARGKLVVGTKADQPGLGQRNPTTNTYEGFDVEIAKLVAVAIFGGTADSLDGKIEFREAVSKNRELFIQNGTVDIVVATYTINADRKKQVDFAGPYFIAHQDILVKATDNSIKSVNDLNGKKVCSVTGSTSEKNVKAKAPQVQVLALDNYSLCTQALLDGRVVAVTTDDAILAGYAAQNRGTLKVVGAPFSDEPYGIGLIKGDDTFRNFIDDVLEASYRDGSWARAFQSTLGKGGLPQPTPPPVDRYSSTGPATSTTTAAGGTSTRSSTTSRSSTTTSSTASTTSTTKP